MKKSVIWSVAVAFVFSLVVAGVAIASDPGPADMVLKTEKGQKPATFTHKKHQDILSCGECHHGMDADGKKTDYAEGMAIAKCESCHNATMAKPELKDFKGAAHANCKECHKKMEKEGKKAPTLCVGCHVKEGCK